MIKELEKIIDPSYIVYENMLFYTYAIVDGVKSPMLWSELEDGILEYEILFKEINAQERLGKVGPFLVKFDFESKVGKEQSRTLLEKCYGNNNTLIMITPLLFERMMERARECFYLYNENGKRDGVLLFYQPRIFHSLVQSYHKDRIYTLFRHIHTIWCEDEDMNLITAYRWDGKEIQKRNIILEEKY